MLLSFAGKCLMPPCTRSIIYLVNAVRNLFAWKSNEKFPPLAAEFRAEECVVCLECEPSYKIEPCSHICLCKECKRNHGKELVVCPLCRTVITKILQATAKQMQLERKPLHELGHSLVSRVIHNKIIIRMIIKTLVLSSLYLLSFFEVWGVILYVSSGVDFFWLTYYGTLSQCPWIWYTTQISLAYTMMIHPIIGIMFGMRLRSILHSDEIWTTKFVMSFPGGNRRFSLGEFCQDVHGSLLKVVAVIVVHFRFDFTVRSAHWHYEMGTSLGQERANLTWIETLWNGAGKLLSYACWYVPCQLAVSIGAVVALELTMRGTGGKDDESLIDICLSAVPWPFKHIFSTLKRCARLDRSLEMLTG
mmetsp:Transcript_83105/g.147111  ORF Transcript_83105/g.147111 Transcript_83105/m.147111 type:complete len:361 (-) Transcript_83105:214-1296(-)